MPRLGASEQAFLSLVKSLHKGKGKENVPTDILSLAQPFGKINGNFTSAPLTEEALWPDHQPATIGAQEDSAETLSVNPLHSEYEVNGETIQLEQFPATYTVIGSNFAPGTTAADIEYALSETCGKMQDCRIISESPLVVAEMVFTEKSRAENVIAAFDNKKADGHLLRLYIKARDTDTPPGAHCEELEQAQTEKDTVTDVIQSEQQPASPILRGRGRIRYQSMDGPGETLTRDEAAPSVGWSETHEVKKFVDKARVEDEGTARKDREEDGSAHIEGELKCQEADAEERFQLKKKDAAQERRWTESWATKLLNVRNLGMEDEEARSIRLAEEKVEKESEAVKSLDDCTQRIVGGEPVATAPLTTATANNTTAGTSAAAEVSLSSRQPSPVPTTVEAAPQAATGPRSNTPLLSSGHAFLQALTKRPIPAKYTNTDSDSTQAPTLPKDILPDELPTATKTQPDSSNAPSSPLAQITRTGTLQTPSGEHTIHIAPQPSSVQDNTVSEQISTTQAKHENQWDFFSQYRAASTPQKPPISPTHHLPSHFALPPRPPRASPRTAPASKIKTLTLLSGSGPHGHVYKPRRYARDELVKIGKAYWQKVFLALLEREGRGRIVVGVTVGV
ncbi:MAG: hypothetical protein Q9199_007793 [Rusavskia elegans]